MAKLVSKTYGEALFSLALERGTMDGLVEEVEAIKEILSENEEFLKLLRHPKVSREEKTALVETVFKNRASDDLVGLMLLLVEKGRYSQMEDVFVYFLDKVREFKHIGNAYVTSAFALSDGQKKQVEERLLETTKYVLLKMDYEVDESLIGGLVIRIGDRVVDSSIRTKLNVMAKELSQIQLTN